MNIEQIEIERLADALSQRLMLQPRWLKLSAACKYMSINKERLKQLAIENKVIGYQETDSLRGDWIFDKESLDKYRLIPISMFKSKAKNIIKSLK